MVLCNSPKDETKTSTNIDVRFMFFMFYVLLIIRKWKKLYYPDCIFILLLIKDHNKVYDTNTKKKQGSSSSIDLANVKKYVPTKANKDQGLHRKLHKEQIMSEAKKNMIKVLEILH